MYYLTNGLNMPILGMIFAFFAVIASFGIGNMTQSNAVASALFSQFTIPTWITGVILLVITAVVILGGIKSIGKTKSFLIPIMITIYLFTALFILGLNFDKVPAAFGLIFNHAFSPFAAIGRFVGSPVAAAIRF